MTNMQGSKWRTPKRTDVIRAATSEFLKNGYATTTLAAIAKCAGVSTATLFNHFPTKADIFGAIMGNVFENDADSLASLPEAGDPRRGLLELGHNYAALLTDPQIRALFRVIIAEVPRFPELGKELYEKGKAPYLRRLEDYLTAEIALGTMRIDDVEMAVRQFLGMINDVIFWPHMLVIDLHDEKNKIDAVVISAVDTLIGAYGQTP